MAQDWNKDVLHAPSVAEAYGKISAAVCPPGSSVGGSVVSQTLTLSEDVVKNVVLHALGWGGDDNRHITKSKAALQNHLQENGVGDKQATELTRGIATAAQNVMQSLTKSKF